jgi:hypothetical protein
MTNLGELTPGTEGAEGNISWRVSSAYLVTVSIAVSAHNTGPAYQPHGRSYGTR